MNMKTISKMNNKDKGEVNDIVHNVRIGIRTKTDLGRCGCVLCKGALKILEDD